MPATEWIHVVELVERSNVNDGYGHVNYSGIFILLTGTLRTKDHIDLMLSVSKEYQRYMASNRPRGVNWVW